MISAVSTFETSRKYSRRTKTLLRVRTYSFFRISRDCSPLQTRLGEYLISAMMQNFDFFSQEECIRFASHMFDDGYLLSWEHHDSFQAASSHYSFQVYSHSESSVHDFSLSQFVSQKQHPCFWPSTWCKPSDLGTHESLKLLVSKSLPQTSSHTSSGDPSQNSPQSTRSQTGKSKSSTRSSTSTRLTWRKSTRWSSCRTTL